MAAILNSAILNLAILDSATLVFPLKLTPTCQDWFPPFAQKKPSLIHSDSTWWWQPSWILPCWIQTPCFLLSDSLKNTLTPLWLWLKLIQSDSNLFILTQLDDGSHLEFYHVGFRHCHLGFRHLLIFSQIDSKTLSLHSDSDTKKFNLINLMMAAILNSPILNSAILESAILQKTLTQTNSIWLTWWWQPSWILPSWILPSWIQPFCTKHWLKLIQSDSNSFILTQLDDGSHLEFCHLEFSNLGFSHLSFSSQTHSHLPRLVPTICTKKNLHSFFLTQLDDGSHLEFSHIGFRHCHLGFRHLLIFSQIHSKTPSLHSDSDSN